MLSLNVKGKCAGSKYAGNAVLESSDKGAEGKNIALIGTHCTVEVAGLLRIIKSLKDEQSI